MTRKNEKLKAKQLDIVLKAIKSKCKDSCCVGDLESWQNCLSESTCPLFPYRLGHYKSHVRHSAKNNEGFSSNSSKNDVSDSQSQPIKEVK